MPELPIEITTQIVRNVRSPADLASWSRVCHQFHELAEPLLYTSVRLLGGKALANFKKTVKSNPSLARRVRTLWIRDPSSLPRFDIGMEAARSYSLLREEYPETAGLLLFDLPNLGAIQAPAYVLLGHPTCSSPIDIPFYKEQACEDFVMTAVPPGLRLLMMSNCEVLDPKMILMFKLILNREKKHGGKLQDLSDLRLDYYG